jgi:hypothetical protein
MELVDGVDLGRLRDATTRRGLRFPLPVAAFIVAEAARGLAYAHDKRGRDGGALGIVHRDISPPNILCSYAGEVKIADFGIAKAAGKLHKTESGAVMGKIRYMSPEQITGEPLDGRSDIFALGVVLWELCGGGPLWLGDNPGAVADEVKNARVEPPSRRARDVPAELDRICLKALERGRDARYARASDLARDLSAWLAATAPSLGREDVGSFVQEVVPRADAESRPLAMAPTVPSGALLAEVAPSGLPEPSAPTPPTPSTSASAATKVARRDMTSRSPAPRLIGIGLVAVLLGGLALLYRYSHWFDMALPLPSVSDAGRLPRVDAAVATVQLSDAEKVRLQNDLEQLPQAEATWRGVQAEDYLTVLSAVDGAICLTPRGATEPILPSLLRGRVEAARLMPETRAVYHYLDRAGELPPRVASSLLAFLRAHPAFAPGAAGWSFARLAVITRPDDPALRLTLIRQNGVLGQWRGERGDPSLMHPELCERQAAVHRYAAAAPGARAQAFERFLAAIPPELPGDADGLRYTLSGAERDEAAAQLLLHLRVTNPGADEKPLALEQLRLGGLDTAPQVDPPALRLGPSLVREVRLTFTGITDELAEAAVLVIPRAPGQAVELQAYSEDLK